MSNPIDELKQKYWINFYYSDNPKAPLCTLELVNRDDKNERYKFPIWKDREKDGFAWIGKIDESKRQSEPVSANNAPVDDLDDEIPF